MTSLADQTIGFIGLGLMGRPMCDNLLAAGADLVVASRSPGPVAGMADRGAEPADSPRAVAERADRVIVMVSDTAAVEAVVEGPDGLLEGLGAGSLVIDMGTTTVTATRRLAKAAPAEKRRMPALRGREDIAAAGAYCLLGLMETLGREEMIIATGGILEGLLRQTAENPKMGRNALCP